MSKTILKVDGMSCNHCKMTIEKNVGELTGVSKVTVDLSSHTVTIEMDENGDLQTVKQTITENGYQVVN